MIKRVLSFLSLSVLVVTGLNVAGAAPASAGLTSDRTCEYFETGDYLRMLSVCSRGWISDSGTRQMRGVVEMHTYKKVAGKWVDSQSQSITLNYSLFNVYNASKFRVGFHEYGTTFGQNTCRVNGPSSSHIACSVPNATRVAFYSPAWTGVSPYLSNIVSAVSWRDDRGVAHYAEEWSLGPHWETYPDQMPVWYQNFSW